MGGGTGSGCLGDNAGKTLLVRRRQWQEIDLICGIKVHGRRQIRRRVDLGRETRFGRLAGRMFREENLTANQKEQREREEQT